MSRSKKVFGFIKKQLSGVELCRDMLVVTPTKHILRGFLIETTMEKGRVYLWRVVFPLHRPMRSVILDYSDRIPATGEDVYIKPDAYKESAEKIGVLVREHLEYLRNVRDPEDFLRHVAWMNGNPSISLRFDLALMYYRLGKVRQSLDIVRALDLEVDQLDKKRRLPFHDVVKHVAREMASNPTGLADLLDEWENRNVETLGLQASRLVHEVPRSMV